MDLPVGPSGVQEALEAPAIAPEVPAEALRTCKVLGRVCEELSSPGAFVAVAALAGFVKLTSRRRGWRRDFWLDLP